MKTVLSTHESGTTVAGSKVDSLLPLRDMRPAFKADALRMLGDVRSHPAWAAVRTGALKFDPPEWTVGRTALSRVASLLSNVLTSAIAQRSLPLGPPPSWARALSSLDRVFGLGLPHHFLHAAPLGWLQEERLTERQITKGFAHLLNAGGRETRTGRIRALLWALGSDQGDSDSDLHEAWATAEAPANRRRIDLLIEWTDAWGRKRGAVIEAKFEHHVTAGQLPTYRTHLGGIERSYRDEVRSDQKERPLLFIVSPLLDRKVSRALSQQKNNDWRWMSWRSLLLAYDRVLHHDHDDDTFREFRRTLWDRAG